MKFRNKVIMLNIAIISVALGVLGFIMIYRNFNQILGLQTDYAIEEHNLLQASVEYQLLDALSQKTKDISDELLSAATSTGRQLLNGTTTLTLIYDGSVLYTNAEHLPEIPDNLYSTLELGSKFYVTTRNGDNYNLFVASQSILNESDLYIITIRNVTGTYSILYDQIKYMVVLILAVLFICAVFLYFISTRLTKPLEKLNEVTDTVASGDYTVLADIDSDDEIGKLTEKFNNMTLAIAEHIEELHQMVKQREQFVADFTHEIKTPMTAIIGYADTLRSKNLSDNNRDMAYQYIYSEGKRLESMSMKLFDLIYLKDNELELSELNTTELVSEIADSMNPLLSKKGLTLVTDIAPSVIYGESELLKTVFINIIDNARKASPNNERILFHGEIKEDSYTFSVKDFGHGMDEETKSHICDEFYMADKSRSRAEGGAGLGMSLVALIIKRHNATLDIESAPGKGTTMSVTLPLN